MKRMFARSWETCFFVSLALILFSYVLPFAQEKRNTAGWLESTRFEETRWYLGSDLWAMWSPAIAERSRLSSRRASSRPPFPGLTRRLLFTLLWCLLYGFPALTACLALYLRQQHHLYAEQVEKPPRRWAPERWLLIGVGLLFWGVLLLLIAMITAEPKGSALESFGLMLCLFPALPTFPIIWRIYARNKSLRPLQWVAMLASLWLLAPFLYRPAFRFFSQMTLLQQPGPWVMFLGLLLLVCSSLQGDQLYQTSEVTGLSLEHGLPHITKDSTPPPWVGFCADVGLPSSSSASHPTYPSKS